MDDKKEGIISTAQDAIVGTAKAGWEGAKDLAETATNAVTDAVSGVAKKRPARRKKAKTAAAKTAARENERPQPAPVEGPERPRTKRSLPAKLALRGEYPQNRKDGARAARDSGRA